jgi:hypothetical protein
VNLLLQDIAAMSVAAGWIAKINENWIAYMRVKNYG